MGFSPLLQHANIGDEKKRVKFKRKWKKGERKRERGKEKGKINAK
jgi:hypothetical protein